KRSSAILRWSPIEARSQVDRRSSGPFSFELSLDYPLQRPDRLKVVRRDFGLRNGQVEFGFHTEHQIDHIHRRQADIRQSRIRMNDGGNRVLLEDCVDESKDPAWNVGVEGLHSSNSPIVVRAGEPKIAVTISASNDAF